MGNEIKRICGEVVYSEKVQRISDMKWAGQKHKSHTGICQFCNNALEYSHYVIKESEVELPKKKGVYPAGYMVLVGSAEEVRAQKMIDTNSIPEGTHIYALASCEEMTDEKLFYRGIHHYEQRVDDWRNQQEEEKAARVAIAEKPTVTIAGGGWGEN